MVDEILLVVNPKAGRAKACRYVKYIEDIFKNDNYSIKTYFTKETTFNADINKLLNDEYKYIICVGGDGTISIIIHEMKIKKLDIPIIYLPSGTSNDLARTIGINGLTTKKLKEVSKMQIHQHDIACVNGRYFDYVLAFGALVNVSNNTPRKAKNLLGSMSYLLKAFTEILKIRKFHCKIEVDSKTVEDDFVLIMITNSYYIGGMKLQDRDKIELDDGKFEIFIYKMPKKLSQWFDVVLSILQHKVPKTYILMQGENIKLTFFKDNISSTVDGENIDVKNTAEIKIISKGIKLLY